jgi:putative FmdB family regulatory protein
MPIYEYRCGACGDEFEVIQRISEGPLVRCDKCGGSLEKLLSRTAFLLKGSGWYSDGYAGSGARKGTDSGDAASKKETSPAGNGGSASKGEGPPSKSAGSSASSD